MTLLRIGHRVLNLDNVTTVNLAHPDGVIPDGSEQTKVRVFFAGGTNTDLSWTDFKGEEAEELRRYFSLHAPTREDVAERDREKIESHGSISRPRMT